MPGGQRRRQSGGRLQGREAARPRPLPPSAPWLAPEPQGQPPPRPIPTLPCSRTPPPRPLGARRRRKGSHHGGRYPLFHVCVSRPPVEARRTIGGKGIRQDC